MWLAVSVVLQWRSRNGVATKPVRLSGFVFPSKEINLNRRSEWLCMIKPLKQELFEGAPLHHVLVAVVQSQGKYVLLSGKEVKGIDGHVYAGERDEVAAGRIIRAKTGLAASMLEFVCSDLRRDGSCKNVQHLYKIYRVAASGELDEKFGAKRYGEDDLKREKLDALTQYWLKQVPIQKFVP